MISLTINGRKLDGEPGETILEVARRNGIEIPALCAEERLAPFDSCGVCTVEVEGRGVVKACSTPIEEAWVIQTDSDAAVEVRKAALELLLSNHWGDCIAPCRTACPAATDCQAYVSLTANGRFLDGLKVLYRNLPLPGVVRPYLPGTVRGRLPARDRRGAGSDSAYEAVSPPIMDSTTCRRPASRPGSTSRWSAAARRD